MGLSKSKTTTGPSKAALPKINQASDAVTAAYNDNKANLGKITSGFSDAFDTYKAGMGASDPTLGGVRAGLGSVFDKYSGTVGMTDPSVAAVRSGLDDSFAAYKANMGKTDPYVDRVKAGLTDSFDAYKAGMGAIDPTITAARSRLTDVLGGKYLSGNPELDAIIRQTNGSIADDVNARFSMSGQTGSSRQIGELGKRLSENESALRYKNYSDEQARMDAAVAAASGLDAQQRASRDAEFTTLGGLGSNITDISSRQAADRNAEFTTLGSLGANISSVSAQDAATKNAGISTMAGLGSTLNGMEDSEAARRNAEIETLLKLGGTAATLPYSGADFLASGLGGLWGSSQTTKSSQGLGTSLMGLAGSALGGWAGGGFKGI